MTPKPKRKARKAFDNSPVPANYFNRLRFFTKWLKDMAINQPNLYNATSHWMFAYIESEVLKGKR